MVAMIGIVGNGRGLTGGIAQSHDDFKEMVSTSNHTR